MQRSRNQILVGLILATALNRSATVARAGQPELIKAPFSEADAKAKQQEWAKALSRSVVETNSLGMQLVLIPPGEFMMGTPPHRGPAGNTDEQYHRVRITHPFYFGVFTVTQAEYEKLIGENPSSFSRSGQSRAKVKGQDTSRFPVENITWDEANEFCQKLGKQEGKTYALPTEAQWEYACRAGTTTPYYFGQHCDSTMANCEGSDNYMLAAVPGSYLERTTTVGSYKPNAFGLYDMLGNASEWCADWLDAAYYLKSPVDDPPGPAAGRPAQPGLEAVRAVRGCSWFGPPMTAAFRSTYYPSSTGSEVVGFRVVQHL
jgi:formylglycine-generating enzyme required for sulfatase activity